LLNSFIIILTNTTCYSHITSY